MSEDYRILGQVLGWQGINPDWIEELLPKKDEPYYVVSGNNVLVKNGVIQKLKGTDYLNDVSTQLGASGYRGVLGLAIYRQLDGDKFLMAILPRAAYYLLNDTTWTPITGSEMTAGENDSVLTCANADDKFIFVVSDDAFPYQWTGAGNISKVSFTAEGVTTLKCRNLLEFKTFLVLLRTIEDATENHQRFWASDAGVITTFKAKNKLDLEEEGVILNGRKLGDNIIVYFEKSLYRVFYDDSYGWLHELISGDNGLISAKSLTGAKGVHFFLSQEGLMTLLYGDMPRSVSDNKFNKLILDELDPVYYYRATAKYYPHLGHLYISYPKSGSSYNDVQIIYDAKAQDLVSYKQLSGENYSTYGEFEKDLSGLDPDERRQYGLSFIPIIGNKDGYVKEQKVNSYQDGSSSYESNVVLPGTFFKKRDRNKRLLQIDLLIEKLTNLNITLKVDLANEMNENYLFNFTITGTGNSGIRRYELRSDDNDVGVDALGKEFKVKIKDSDNPYGWNFRGAIFRGYYSTVN